MKILALIPARGGSKRLPKKNIKNLGHQPLILWSIDAARNLPEVCDIMVSTDDPEIADICRKGGAYVPWLRPAEFATDTANSVDVALHAVNWYEQKNGAVDGLLLLQPTSPFRVRSTLQIGIELFATSGMQTVIGVSPTHQSPMWMLKIVGRHLTPYVNGGDFESRAEDQPAAFIANGSFYLISPIELRTNMSFLSSRTLPLVMNSHRESLDIDTEWDFQLAELYLTDNCDR